MKKIIITVITLFSIGSYVIRSMGTAGHTTDINTFELFSLLADRVKPPSHYDPMVAVVIASLGFRPFLIPLPVIRQRLGDPISLKSLIQKLDEKITYLLNFYQCNALQEEQVQLNDDLIYAIRKQEFNKVQELLTQGAHVDGHSSSLGTTPLIAAVSSATTTNEIVLSLLNSWHADVNNTDKAGFTALMWAVMFKNMSIIDILLSEAYSTNVMITNHDGQTALDLAEEIAAQEESLYQEPSEVMLDIINKLKAAYLDTRELV